MRYVISDIHGCYKQYMELLDKIQLSESDVLYVLGDAMDRGPEPIRVIRDIMKRPNVKYLWGNHDYLMSYLAEDMLEDIKNNRMDINQLGVERWNDYQFWIEDGGEVTINQLSMLTDEGQKEVLDYLDSASVYEIIEEKGKRYILVHAGIDNFIEEKQLEDYDLFDFIAVRMDYGRRYYSDKNTYIITGHSPTPLIRKDYKPLVYRENGHIAIDCGCVFGGRLAAYCIETGKVTYVEGYEHSTVL